MVRLQFWLLYGNILWLKLLLKHLFWKILPRINFHFRGCKKNNNTHKCSECSGETVCTIYPREYLVVTHFIWVRPVTTRERKTELENVMNLIFLSNLQFITFLTGAGWCRVEVDDWCRYENITNISVSSSNNVEMRTNYQTHRHSIDLCCPARYFNIFHESHRLDEYLDSHH